MTSKTSDSIHPKVVEASSENIHLAAILLREAHVIGIPTETVYGLGGLISSDLAVSKIFAVKERPRFDPLIVHIPASIEKSLENLSRRRWIAAHAIDPADRTAIEKLMQAFWPGPLTLVLPKHPNVSDLVTSGLGSVALRMPAHPVFQALLQAVDEGIAAPSANRFGRISPVTASDVASELGDRVSLILDGGRSSIGVESTVLGYVEKKGFLLLRPGGLPREEIEATLGEKLDTITPTSRPEQVAAPGMLDSHYAPEKLSLRLARPIRSLSAGELKLVADHLRQHQPHLGMLSLLSPHGENAEAAVRFEAATGIRIARIELSRNENDLEAAQNLFSALRAFDLSPSTLLLIEPVERLSGLFLAIEDRLKRASRPLVF